MSIKATIRRRTEEKELRMAGELLGTREDLDARGMTFLGSLSMAAGQGWYTPRACERMGRPVTPDELAGAARFAMMMTCYADSCLKDKAGKRVRPCLPVFFRSVSGEE